MASRGQRIIALSAAVLFLVSSLALSGYVIWEMVTKKDAPKTDTASIEEQLKKFQEENMLKGTKLENYTPASGVDSLQKIDLVPGDGAEATKTSKITVHYTGALAKDGTIFESSKDSGEPVSFSLEGGLIQGWLEGLPGTKVNGTRRLLIPANMAYGEAGSPPAIGPNEPLVFDIELLAVE